MRDRSGQSRGELEREIDRLEQELSLVCQERDSLRRRLEEIEGMQTDTVAWEDPVEQPAAASPSQNTGADLPSIAELMAEMNDTGPAARPAAPLEEPAAADAGRHDSGWHELLPATEIVAGASPDVGKPVFTDTARWELVRTDVEPNERFRLTEPLMTIGRSGSADIQVDTGFISRIHARLLLIDAQIVVEDAGSRNGIRVNDERVDRTPLANGDTLAIGQARFRFVDNDF